LEEVHRPTHFAGVCQVVARLFDLVQPAIAIFGEKDYQQLLVVQAMVARHAKRWPGLRIVPHPTVREPDGLAMSSRNMYLKPQQRDQALGLFRALRAAQGESSPTSAERVMAESLAEHELKVDYAVVRDAKTLMPIDSYKRAARALIAARLGAVRLIDNMVVGRQTISQ
jgi:pantoate--beta-alanine ligase